MALVTLVIGVLAFTGSDRASGLALLAVGTIAVVLGIAEWMVMG